MIDVERLTNKFWSKIKTGQDNECWEWGGYKDRDGYGRYKINGGPKGVHRIIWTFCFGDIDEKQCVCHRCDNPSCVNISHLFLGTNIENIQDKVNKNRTYKRVTFNDAVTIRKMYSSGDWPIRKIAEHFNVSTAVINNVIKQKTWKDGGNPIYRTDIKLKPEDVINIRKLFVEGLRQKELSAMYGIDVSHIGKIIRKQKWRNV